MRLPRRLTPEEKILLSWLLKNGKPEAASYLAQLDDVEVVATCPCGCPSIEFLTEPEGGMQILADYGCESHEGSFVGVMATANGGRLSGMEIWSADGEKTPTSWPSPDDLEPLEPKHAV